MTVIHWPEAIGWAGKAGPALTTSTASTDITPTDAKTIVGSCSLHQGQVIRIVGAAQLSNIVTTPGNFGLHLMYNAAIVWGASNLMLLSTTANTTLPLWFEFLIIMNSSGTAATASVTRRCTGKGLSLLNVATSTTVVTTLVDQGTTSAIDTTLNAAFFSVNGQFSVSNAGNNITVQQLLVEVIN